MKIDKDVPVPSSVGDKSGRGRPRVYPFGEMEVGDSIFTESKGARNAAGHYAKYHGKKFATRTENNGVRIWRIK